MTTIQDISKNSETSVLILFTVIFLILPGTTSIYLFKPDLFNQLDWVKIILLSASITSPFVLFNTILVSILESSHGNKDSLFVNFSLATILTGLLVYLVVIINIFQKNSFRTSLIILAVLEVLIILMVIILRRKNIKI